MNTDPPLSLATRLAIHVLGFPAYVSFWCGMYLLLVERPAPGLL